MHKIHAINKEKKSKERNVNDHVFTAFRQGIPLVARLSHQQCTVNVLISLSSSVDRKATSHYIYNIYMHVCIYDAMYV